MIYATSRDLYLALRLEFPKVKPAHVWFIAKLWPKCDDQAKALHLMREHFQYASERVR